MKANATMLDLRAAVEKRGFYVSMERRYTRGECKTLALASPAPHDAWMVRISNDGSWAMFRWDAKASRYNVFIKSGLGIPEFNAFIDTFDFAGEPT